MQAGSLQAVTGIIQPGSTEAQRRRAQGALHDPHDAKERMDPEFMLLTVCSSCGKQDMVKRRDVSDAIRVHATEECPNRHNGDLIVVRVLYPKQ